MVYLDNSFVIIGTKDVWLDNIENFSLSNLLEIATKLDKHGESNDEIKQMIFFVFEKLEKRDVSPAMEDYKSISEEILDKRLNELIKQFEL